MLGKPGKTFSREEMIKIENKDGLFNSAISIINLCSFVTKLCDQTNFSNAAKMSPIFLGFEPKIKFSEVGAMFRNQFGVNVKSNEGRENFTVELTPAKLAGFEPESFGTIFKNLSRRSRRYC